MRAKWQNFGNDKDSSAPLKTADIWCLRLHYVRMSSMGLDKGKKKTPLEAHQNFGKQHFKTQ